MLLAIDSSTGTSVAIVDPRGVVLARAGSADTRRHAEVVGSAIADALAEAGVAPADIDAVAVGMGPGPFTGLRVGIAAARAFALATGARLVPLVSHDAAALEAAETDGGPDAVLVVTDARRREIAFSTYEGGRRTRGPELARPEELAEHLPDLERWARVDAATIDAGALGRLALRADAEPAPDPLYLRPPDIAPQAAPKRVAQ